MACSFFCKGLVGISCFVSMLCHCSHLDSRICVEVWERKKRNAFVFWFRSPSSPARLLLKNCLLVWALLRGWLRKQFILFLESLQQWFSDTCPSHECLLPFRSLLLYTLDFHPTRYSLRPNHGELSENSKIDKERKVNSIGHQHGSKSCSGWVHCLSKDLLQPERNFWSLCFHITHQCCCLVWICKPF